MSIKNREDANKYYKIVNDVIDSYIKEYKIKPNNLMNYFKPGSKRFSNLIKRNGLGEINGIDKILIDVLEDRVHGYKEGILTFESFSTSDYRINSIEECLWKGIEKADINYEKFLADYYDTNLSKIDILDPYKHLFEVDGGQGSMKVLIHSNEDLGYIKDNFIEYFKEEFYKKDIEISGMIFPLDEMIDEESIDSMLNEKFSNDEVIRLITDSLKTFEFVDELEDFILWVSKDN